MIHNYVKFGAFYLFAWMRKAEATFQFFDLGTLLRHGVITLIWPFLIQALARFYNCNIGNCKTIARYSIHYMANWLAKIGCFGIYWLNCDSGLWKWVGMRFIWDYHLSYLYKIYQSIVSVSYIEVFLKGPHSRKFRKQAVLNFEHLYDWIIITEIPDL